MGARLGRVEGSDGDSIEVETTVEAMPSVLWDAVVLPSGAAAQPAFQASGGLLEFVKDQYRHCKAMLVLGESSQLVQAAGIPLPDAADGALDPGLVVVDGTEDALASATTSFLAAVARHRHYERETDPPRV